MIGILNVTVPFFALVGCGWLAARLALLPGQAVPALNAFVLWFALPAMLLRFAAQTPFSTLADPAVFGAYALSGLFVLVLTLAGLRWAAGEGWRDAALGALSASWSNWGYMGFALIPALLGPQALAALIAAGVADLLVVVSAALAVASREGRAPEPWWHAISGAMAGVGRNPLVWAIAAGALLSAVTGIRGDAALPPLLGGLVGLGDRLLALLGTAAGPVALFAMGAALHRPAAGNRMSSAAPTSAATPLALLTIVGTKLLVHPLATWTIARHVFGLPHDAAAVLTLMAALPAAGTAFLFAERHGADAGRAATAILVSTVAAFLTFPGFAALLAQPAA